MKKIVGSLSIVFFTIYLLLHYPFTFWENVTIGALVFFEVAATIFFVYVDYYLKK